MAILNAIDAAMALDMGNPDQWALKMPDPGAVQNETQFSWLTEAGTDVQAYGLGFDVFGGVPATGLVQNLELDFGNDNFFQPDVIVSGVSFGLPDVVSNPEGLLALALVSDDTINGSHHDDKLYGFDGKDLMFSAGGNDTLFGGEGNDTLHGNAGQDRMSGGEGADRFVYFNLADSKLGATRRDVITDFESGVDRIEISRLDANATKGGNQAFEFIGTGQFTGDAGEPRYFKSAVMDATIIQADRNGDGVQDWQIELLGRVDLEATDFVL